MSQDTARPIFIVGAPRSGTTAIMEALRGGAKLPGYNEGHVLPLLDQLHQTIDDYFASLDRRILVHKDKQLLGWLDDEELKDHITSKFVEIVEARLGSDVWIDKTPTAGMIRAVPRLAAIFPRSRFVFAKRRGIENVLSRAVKFPNHPLKTQCQLWAESMDLWLHVRAALPRERYIEIDLHDIALHPEKTAQSIGAFLGLSREQTDGIRETWLSQRPEQSRAAQDYRYIGLDETGWSEEDQAVFAQVCGPLMERYGYALDGQVFREAFQRPVYLYYPIAGVVEGEITTEHVRPDGFRLYGRGFLLHPNEPGRHPATLRYHGLEFFGHNHFSAEVTLKNPNAEPVEVRLRIEQPEDRALVFEHCIDVAAGQRVPWEVPLPDLEGAYDVTVSTAMARAAQSNDEAWTVWKRPHFFIKRGGMNDVGAR